MPETIMRDLGDEAITEAVLETVANASDPRLRQINEALIRHLHAFIRETKPSEEEWKAGIDFLTATGKKCSETRQEFILLSDVLGVSMLVDAINHRSTGHVTETTVFGPFYVAASTFENGDDISGHLDGVPMYIGGTVGTEDGEPIAGALVDIWHSDREGFYDLQKLHENPQFAGRGRFLTDETGAFSLWTIRPSPYPIPNDGPVGQILSVQNRHPFRPEHVHFMIQATGHRTLVTHLFAEGGAYLDSDVVFGVKESLIRRFETMSDGHAPDGRAITGTWVRLHHDFILERFDGA